MSLAGFVRRCVNGLVRERNASGPGDGTASPATDPEALIVGSSSAGLIEGPGTPITFNADGLVTVHSAEFLEEPKFAEAARLGMVTTESTVFAGAHVEWRIFVCCWAASHAKHLDGDFVECGVNTGIFSRAVMHYVDFAAMPDRRFYLLDTYQGLVEAQLSESELAAGLSDNRYYPDCYEQVCKTFEPFANARIIRGTVPDTLTQIDSDRIAYASIDMNCVAPEIAAGEFLWPRMQPGAMVVLDDYGWRRHIMQKRAWDAFALERGVKILALPTGQGLLVKP